ncbi:hypothetical protein CBM2631_A250227 [Cupriavidus taiwanensis]|nr:hypothetical protein CBM2588_A180224 [Cupriavidus taiwanensis]SOZ57966.1 hypothetical protein CBM2617_A260078 [Cupriavidus taiwanensis]SOZ79769.1 hypothetical protein CBM2618_A230082 [Cupriavidus taiwanensis]SOZ80418.1 hypothetical protein CBM2622_A210226 [Cupriavidus taiwanensis]SOZ87964.1 hypothetical protein CBM2621_A210226 [Cupriavidus taiwanensis]
MISSTTSPWFNASREYWEQRMHFSGSPCGTYAEIRKTILIDIQSSAAMVQQRRHWPY